MTKRPKHIICLRVLFAILILAIATFIFYMSAQDAATSSKTSSGVIVKIISALDNSYKFKSPQEQKILIRSLQKIVRKSAHFCIYGLLGVFSASFLATFKLRFIGRFLISQGFCSLYAVSDELHQRFVAGRNCEIRDMLIDSGGCFCGIIVILFFVYLIERRKEVKSVMRKKELLKQNQSLADKLIEADGIIESLKNLLKDKDDEIRLLNEKIAEISNRKTGEQEEVLEEKSENSEEEPNEVAEAAEPTKIIEQDYHDFDFVAEQTADKNTNINEYAVMTIGKIVTESVKVNCVLASSNNENKKELLNLILGRTEVAKEEISSILATDLNPDLLITSIDKECAETLEYFQSILAQL